MRATFSGADLIGAHLSEANLSDANLSHAWNGRHDNGVRKRCQSVYLWAA